MLSIQLGDKTIITNTPLKALKELHNFIPELSILRIREKNIKNVGRPKKYDNDTQRIKAIRESQQKYRDRKRSNTNK